MRPLRFESLFGPARKDEASVPSRNEKMEDRRKQVGDREKEENEQTSANTIN